MANLDSAQNVLALFLLACGAVPAIAALIAEWRQGRRPQPTEDRLFHLLEDRLFHEEVRCPPLPARYAALRTGVAHPAESRCRLDPNNAGS